MSVTQATSEHSSSDSLRCTRCDALLPANATFCGTCGERVERGTDSSQPQNDASVAERYRITSFVRRRPYVQLFLGLDNQHQRPVAIRDIDVGSLDDSTRVQAIHAAQQEYDLLRRQRVPDVMPVIDLRYFQGHLFIVAGWPFAMTDPERDPAQLYTLQDLLQSDVGLPGELGALSWIHRLCNALAQLHSYNIILGDLDPYTILVSDNNYNGQPALMVSWLPLPIRNMLSHTSTTTNVNSFSAPEALHGIVDPRSDIYSLGAILYLLLTGTAPDEPRTQRPLQTPRELNPQLSSGLDAVVMRALSLESSDRFQNAHEMSEALLQLYLRARSVQPTNTSIESMQGVGSAPTGAPGTDEPHFDDPEDVTISIVPLQARLARWYLSKTPTGNLGTQTEQSNDQVLQSCSEDGGASSLSSATDTQSSAEDVLPSHVSEPLPEPMPRPASVPRRATTGKVDVPLVQRFKEQITGVLPALSRLGQARNTQKAAVAPAAPTADAETSFLKRLQRFILGEQQRNTTAAALIETPLRIQPNQGYAVRIHLMGREEPTLPSNAKKGASPAGLSALVQGEVVHIEVRSALYQNYAYVVQRADVHIPGRGYAAEVTIPMQPLSSGPSGRRERLHIFFTDEMRRPLYERPFVVELFISHLVQSGREGHNVLTIPL